MKLDIPAFGLGALAIATGSLALWASFGEVSWAWVGRAAPIALILTGIAMLVLSRKRVHQSQKGNQE